MANKYRGSSIKRGNLVSVYGMDELLNKVEKAGGNVNDAVQKCVDNSLELVGLKMQLFMMEHRETGDTYRSYEHIKASIKENKVEAMVGYEVAKGGLPAIFLDVGTPKQTPYFFRYYAVENSSGELREIQKNTIEEILKELR